MPSSLYVLSDALPKEFHTLDDFSFTIPHGDRSSTL